MFPRRIVGGQVWFITRRCLERRYFLRPDPEVVRIFEYCIARAAERTGVRLHAWIQMSNHLHLLVEDVDARLPEFLQIAHWLIARAVNRYLGRRGHFFEAGAPDCIPIETFEDVVRVAAYIEANPVSARLVRKAVDWPGSTSARLEYGQEIEAVRPVTYFVDDDDEDGGSSMLPLRLCSLPFAEGLLPEQQRHKIRRAVRRREAQVAKEVREEGDSFLGVKGVLRMSPWAYPTTDDDKRRPVGRYSTCDPAVGERVWRRDFKFRVAHTEARKRWMKDKKVLFPFGTYWLRVFAGVDCYLPDPFEDRVA
ncbi:MAG: hypothetical protein RL885_26900 [Planctomycetota bacterium]